MTVATAWDMASRTILVAAALALTGCLLVNGGAPLGRTSGPTSYANGVATDSIEEAAMLQLYNDTKCSFDAMQVRERRDVRVNAIEVRGCAVTRVYSCVNEVSEQRGRFVSTRYVCTEVQGATAL
jgi:hypothetical protein